MAGGEAPPFALSLRGELQFQAPEFQAADTCCDETAFWLYSSGSTGMPKGVRHVHSSPMETARLTGQQCLGVREDDLVFSAAKLFFAYGLGNAMSFPMSVGATAVLLPERPTPEVVFRTLKQYQPTLFFGVPTLYAGMLAYPQGTPDNGSQRLRLCVSAGEALPAEVGKAFRAKFGVDVLDGVGSTEMLHQYVCNSPTRVKYGTSGKPIPGYEVRLVDEHGKDVADGEVGEMLVKGPSAAEGYWNQREKSRATFEGGWTRSGDKYTRDAEGYYAYQGRTDDMFKVSGIWVSPFEVESALVGHDAVLEAAVVPKEDGDGLLKPKAFIVLKPGKTAANGLDEELKEHVKAKAGAVEIPPLGRVRRRPAEDGHGEDPEVQAAGGVRRNPALPTGPLIRRRQCGSATRCPPRDVVCADSVACSACRAGSPPRRRQLRSAFRRATNVTPAAGGGPGHPSPRACWRSTQIAPASRSATISPAA